MLRSLDYIIPSDGACPTQFIRDNLSVILNSQNPAADLSKRHIDISVNIVIEAVAASIIKPYCLKGEFNTSDSMIKYIPQV